MIFCVYFSFQVLYFFYPQGLMNIVVSGDYAGLWKVLFQRNLNPGAVGFFGMVSAAMAIYEEMITLHKYVISMS